jgi:hypothetical protein
MAKKIDGTKIACEVLSEVSDQLKQIQKDYPDFKPGLAIVQVLFFLVSLRFFAFIYIKFRWVIVVIPTFTSNESWRQRQSLA